MPDSMPIPSGVRVISTNLDAWIRASEKEWRAFLSDLHNPGDSGEFDLTLLPAQPQNRVVRASGHFHDEADRAHLSLELSSPPESTPPASVIEASASLGDIPGFVKRLSALAASADVTGMVQFDMPPEWRCTLVTEFGRRLKVPPKVTGVQLRHVFELGPNDRLEDVRVLRTSGGDRWLFGGRTKIQAELEIGPSVFETFEESMWEQLHRFAVKKQRARSG